jgi:hypothetical protein
MKIYEQRHIYVVYNKKAWGTRQVVVSTLHVRGVRRAKSFREKRILRNVDKGNPATSRTERGHCGRLKEGGGSGEEKRGGKRRGEKDGDQTMQCHSYS